MRKGYTIGSAHLVGISMGDSFSYSGLGANGRFGNQMFQYAALFSIAQENNSSLIIPDSVERHDFPLKGRYEILEAFPNLSAKLESPEKLSSETRAQYRERGFSYDPNFRLIKPNIDLHGYFQSEMYFKEYREQLLHEFKFSKSIESSSKEKIDDIKTFTGNSGLCAVHIRRGDYQNNPEYHTNLSGEYYNAAVQHMVSTFENVQPVIFSDDVEWCQNNLPAGMVYSGAESQFQDMCMMSLCDYHIIANSSFSWWGSWLSESKRTIAPKQWFGPRGPKDWSTIYREGWYVI